METFRSSRSSYVAAFLLGALIALLIAAPTRGATPGPLDRIAVVQFTVEPDGRLAQQHAVLHDDGRLSLRARIVSDRPSNTPDWVLGRNLVSVEAWHAYHSLGYNALDRFELQDFGARVYIGSAAFLVVGPSFDVSFGDGRIANVSTRARLGPSGDIAVVGFVVEHRPRLVLIRAVGPTLQRFGIGTWMADPFLSIKRGNGQTLYFNDNWSTAFESESIRRAAAHVGAFALDENSRDAARLVELEPGSYTLHVEHATPNATAGEALIEIYTVPAEIIE